jgi:hypothetical protein
MTEPESPPEPIVADAPNLQQGSNPGPNVVIEAEVPAAQESPEDALTGGINLRRSRWATSADALRYIGTLTRTDGVKIRDSDRATSIALLIVTILTIIAPWVRPLAQMRATLFILCDIFIAAVIFFYAVNRFGIINTLTPRQAILCWQLMLVFIYVGVFLTVNMGYVIGLVIANTSIQIPH